MQRNLHIVSGETAMETLRADILDVVNRLVDQLEELHDRVAALESGRQTETRVIDFAASRRSWSVKQLATDLNVHPNTVLNWLALPADHPRHLESFQPGGAGPHLILPEHIADWLARNQEAA